MFKKFVLALAVALAIPAVAAAQKLGTVDTQSVFQDMPETAAAQTQLNEASKKYEDEFKKLQEEVDKKYQELQALAADTPDAGTDAPATDEADSPAEDGGNTPDAPESGT